MMSVRQLLRQAAISAVIGIAAIASTSPAVAQLTAQSPLVAKALAEKSSAKAAAAVPLGYSAKTKLGILMDDPAALAILTKHAPAVIAAPDIAEGRNYTLKTIANFDRRLGAVLPAIEAELATLPVRNGQR